MSMKNFQSDEVCAGIRGSRPIKPIGFTLLEIMVSLAIVGILSGIAYPLYTGYLERTRVAAASVMIQTISTAISRYYSDYQQYPVSLNDVGRATLLDPWGRPYRYLNIQTAHVGQMRKNRFLVPINSDYDLYSMGKDGMSAPPVTAGKSRDDIIRANDGAYIGLASNF